ncbi:MAG: T9SS type A sorting domain-containing protein [Bacteroidales bacterium]|nr:T9SS type A sorting domain-containing protein [Bacteroidales bacterium]
MKKIITFIFALTLIVFIGNAQDYNKVREILSARGEAKILVKANENTLENLSLFTSIDKKIENEYLVYVNEKQFNKFLTLGLDYRLYNEEKSEKLIKVATSIEEMLSWNCYPSYQVYVDLMQNLAQDFPNICRLDTIGFSTENRLILSLKIYNNTTENNPKFFYSSTIHGDELTGAVVLLRLADYLLKNHQSNNEIGQLISDMQIYICPIANPDGVYAGGDNNISNATRYNANYIDLNRNFPNPKYGSHPDGEEHQKETLAFMQYALEEDFDLSINLHGGAEVCNYPWDTWTENQKSHPDKDWFLTLCQTFITEVRNTGGQNYFTDVSHTGITNGGDWYRIYGSRQDWQNYYTKAREITLEVSTTKTPSSNRLPLYWNYLKDGLIGFINNSLTGVEGVIKDITNQETISNATIEVLGIDFDSLFTYSNHQGYYFRPLLSGNYEIKIHSQGYNDTIVNINIEDNSTLTQNIYLSPSLTSLTPNEELSSKSMIYPNPCRDKLFLCFKKLFAYNISDFRGNILINHRNNFTNTIDVSELPAGVYFLNVFLEKETKTLIFIKQ